MSLDYTGERVVPGVTPAETLQEHVARYLFARSYVRDRVVLDVACGTGYGSGLLHSAQAREVVGGDRSASALEHARAQYSAPGLRYVELDAMALPFPDASFDVVVSMETIEHLPRPDVFLGECRRCLRPGGLFIGSTPNQRSYSLGMRRPFNPFHVQEFTARSFQRLLGSVFPAAGELYAQYTMGWRARVRYELWYLDHRFPAVAPLLRRVKARANAGPVAAASLDLAVPEVTPRYRVVPLRNRLGAPATYFVAVRRKDGR